LSEKLFKVLADRFRFDFGAINQPQYLGEVDQEFWRKSGHRRHDFRLLLRRRRG